MTVAQEGQAACPRSFYSVPILVSWIPALSHHDRSGLLRGCLGQGHRGQAASQNCVAGGQNGGKVGKGMEPEREVVLGASEPERRTSMSVTATSRSSSSLEVGRCRRKRVTTGKGRSKASVKMIEIKIQRAQWKVGSKVKFSRTGPQELQVQGTQLAKRQRCCRGGVWAGQHSRWGA